IVNNNCKPVHTGFHVWRLHYCARATVAKPQWRYGCCARWVFEMGAPESIRQPVPCHGSFAFSSSSSSGLARPMTPITSFIDLFCLLLRFFALSLFLVSIRMPLSGMAEVGEEAIRAFFIIGTYSAWCRWWVND